MIVKGVIAFAVLKGGDKLPAGGQQDVKLLEEADNYVIAQIIEKPQTVNDVLGAEFLQILFPARHLQGIILANIYARRRNGRFQEMLPRKIERRLIIIKAEESG